MITNTNPYDNKTQNEVELQIMYCIALTFREIYDHLEKSLKDQNLVSHTFKTTVQNELRWFYRYVFIIKDFRQYQIMEVQNPMFSLMRFLMLPTNKGKNLISEYIYEAFDKEIGLTPADMYECHSLYYIP